MDINLELDDEIVKLAQELGNHKTKEDAVTQALKDYVKRKQQLSIITHFGSIDFDSSFDYKRARRK